MELQKLYVTLALDATSFKTGMATVTGIVAAGAIAASAAIAKVAFDGVKAAISMEVSTLFLPAAPRRGELQFVHAVEHHLVTDTVKANRGAGEENQKK